MIKTKKRGDLIIISGTTCAGKGTVIKKLLERHNDIVLSISYTSRAKRDYETNGVEYYFVTREEFERKIRDGELLEYNEYAGNYYGTPRKEVVEKLETGKDVVLEVLIFIMAPSMEEVKRRIKMRGAENNEQILARFKTAYNEINQVNNYNYVVVNDDVEEAVKKVESILVSEKLRVDRIEEIFVENQEEIIHEFLIEKEFVNEERDI